MCPLYKHHWVQPSHADSCYGPQIKWPVMTLWPILGAYSLQYLRMYNDMWFHSKWVQFCILVMFPINFNFNHVCMYRNIFFGYYIVCSFIGMYFIIPVTPYCNILHFIPGHLHIKTFSEYFFSKSRMSPGRFITVSNTEYCTYFTDRHCDW